MLSGFRRVSSVHGWVPVRCLHDRSSVPRVVDDREKSAYKVHDVGYKYRYHQSGIEALPRLPGCRTPVSRPDYKVRDAWRESQARFGQNDYIDILGDGRIHPAQLQYHTPLWLRGFPGQHRANELVKLIHYRNIYKDKVQTNSPRRWHELQKRIKYLLMYHNYNKQAVIQFYDTTFVCSLCAANLRTPLYRIQRRLFATRKVTIMLEDEDELGRERNLGLWDEKPDYFFKDKSRRSYTDLV